MAVEKATVQGSALLSRFRKIVLGWDYFNLLRQSSKKRKEASSGLQSVKDTYRDVDEYIGIFEPLLFEEVKAHIVQGQKDDEEVGVGAVEWQKGAVAACEEVNGFHMVSLAVLEEFRNEVAENDLLLLSKEKFEEGAALPMTYAFALVEHRGGKETLTLRTFLDGEVKHVGSEAVESSPRLLKMLSILQMNESFLWILKLTSLSTIMREYSALRSIGSLPFKNLILSAIGESKDNNSQERPWDVPKLLMDSLKYNHNESQLAAICAGLSRRTFVLIQGPPGTGKTQTILGLLSAVLHSSPAKVRSRGDSHTSIRKAELPLQDKYHHWIKASPWLTNSNPRDEIMPVDGDDGFFPSSGNELKPEIVNSNRKYRVHVLVCAPSNSALDEIVLRVLHTGIRDENDHVYNPKIVRIGLKPHHSVQAVSMDNLVEQKLAGVDRSTSGARKGATGPLDRDQIRASIVDEAAIVFATLSFSGSTVFNRMNRVFDVVIIDEAAQAVEPATLIPLAHGCKQVFLVGDPVQLPATVISSTAEKLGYGKSLFKRFQEAGYPVQMLTTQYRMHPEIRFFPSKEFYSESLEDGELVKVQTRRPWHKYCCFGPFAFFDVDGTESQTLGSWVNEDEVEFIMVLYRKLATDYPQLKSSSEMAIITPYSQQLKLLRQQFHVIFGTKSNQLVDINTVDGFQGREKDVAIFSCVRSNQGRGIGFVSDFRRMNVGITRARSSVLVVGSASTLMQDKHWKNLINSAKDRNCYFKISKPYTTFFTESNLKPLIVKGPEPPKEEKTDSNVGEAAAATIDALMVDDQMAVDTHDDPMDDGGDD
ncbi:putative helicase MAGATAMA 3 [Acorus calamus]|uniref:Helicase MAGATAMA 3 n=1 Tax=Acorus calamus TaxID=4465 RepID=A0AAV9FGE8_ACOCL|nr:putative helicase MAGATAMA 3 [Acorus calamus]